MKTPWGATGGEEESSVSVPARRSPRANSQQPTVNNQYPLRKFVNICYDEGGKV